MAFWHFSQTDIWPGWCFVAHKEALSGTSPTRAGTALLPRGRKRRACCRTSALQLTSACSASSQEVTWEKGTPAHDTQLFTVVAYHGCSQPWASMEEIHCSLVGPGQVRSGSGLQAFCDSINNTLIFSSCQTKEAGRLKLTLILAHICRRDSSSQT